MPARRGPSSGRSAQKAADAGRDLSDDYVAGFNHPIGGWVERLIVAVRDDHPEVVFRSEGTHPVFDDCGQFEFFQADPRIVMKRLHARIGNRRGASKPLQLELGFASCERIDDFPRVGRRTVERSNDPRVERGVHRFFADDSDSSGNRGQCFQIVSKFRTSETKESSLARGISQAGAVYSTAAVDG